MYYQWVSIILCFQALLFYLPRYLWTTWEGGRIRLLVKDLGRFRYSKHNPGELFYTFKGGPLISTTWTAATRDKLVAYMVCGKYSHNMYCLRHTMCEVLNCLNAVNPALFSAEVPIDIFTRQVGQIFLMDWLLTGQFSLYGILLTVFEGLPSMNKIFPKLTKCKFMRYGPSGNYEIHDTMCVLPLNILNEKLFLILWFWIFFLSFVSFFALVYRALIYFVPKVRVYLLMAQARHLGIAQARTIVAKLTYSDFFVLYHIGKNINPLMYKELAVGIYNACSGRIPLNNYVTFADV